MRNQIMKTNENHVLSCKYLVFVYNNLKIKLFEVNQDIKLLSNQRIRIVCNGRRLAVSLLQKDDLTQAKYMLSLQWSYRYFPVCSILWVSPNYPLTSYIT